MSNIRSASPYNIFLHSEIAVIKRNNPDVNHATAFKMASSNWKTSAMNPRNKVVPKSQNLDLND